MSELIGYKPEGISFFEEGEGLDFEDYGSWVYFRSHRVVTEMGNAILSGSLKREGPVDNKGYVAVNNQLFYITSEGGTMSDLGLFSVMVYIEKPPIGVDVNCSVWIPASDEVLRSRGISTQTERIFSFWSPEDLGSAGQSRTQLFIHPDIKTLKDLRFSFSCRISIPDTDSHAR